MSLESAISNLVGRLEAVTARLEKVEKQVVSGAGSAPAAQQGSSSGSSSGGDDHPAVQAYDALIAEYVTPFVEVSSKISPETKQQSDLFAQAVAAQRKMIALATKAKKPADAEMQNVIKPTSDLMQEIVALRDKQRTSKFFTNLSTVSEGVGALGWVVVSPTPGPHVKDMRGGSEFYSNRLLKDFKDKDNNQLDFVKHFNGFLKELETYIKKFHTTGLTWNPQGADASKVTVSGPAAPAPAAAAPAKPAAAPAAGGAAKPDISNVFSALSKGTEVTSGLKKVTDDMKAKNRDPSERSSVVPASSSKAPAASKAGSGEKTGPSRPAKLALEGNKWVVEFQSGAQGLRITETEPRQTIYIYRCENTTIQISGKVNTIIIDACKKVGVVFENAISGIEVVNSTGLEVQVTGKVPSVAIDKTTGIQLYLGKDALDTEIVSSKSSEMNVLVPGKDENSDLVEIAIPEQYKTLYKGGKLITESVQHV